MRNTILRMTHGARLVALGAAALLLVSPASLDAHDIPSRVTVFIFAKPEPNRLRLVIGAPLEAMRDINWPMRDVGYLDIAHADSLTRDAAQLWIAGFIQAYENGTQLPEAHIVATRISVPSDRSFTSYDSALAHATSPRISAATDLPWQQALIDVVLDYPASRMESNFAIRPQLARLGLQTTTVLRFVTPSGAE